MEIRRRIEWRYHIMGIWNVWGIRREYKKKNDEVNKTTAEKVLVAISGVSGNKK